jgi:lipid II:glycine glycyltransferase (peptidoglycan interpeptide bridge formation enzyme)
MPNFSIKIINNKKQWENFAGNHANANFLQSYNWGLFHQKLNKKFFPLAMFDKNDQQIACAMVIKEEAKRGDYFTIAGGPLLDWQGSQAKDIFTSLTAYLKTLAKKENCVFIRIRPQADDTPRIRSLFTQAGLKKAPMHLTADLTLRLNLSLSDEEILKQMRKNTRYEIRKGLREGITTKIITDPNFMDEFYKYQLYLAKKHQFVPFEHDFLKLQFETFLTDNQVAFVNSYQDDQLLASAFIIFYQDEAVYHYGVSTPANEKLPGSYVTQWRAIQEARSRGCKIYNFWGVSPLDRPDHRFAGVSLFKRGFGGEEVQHLPAHDLAVSKFYFLTNTFEKMRKKARDL